MESAEQVSDFAAGMGLTKQMGGVAATDELVALCHIDRDSYVLDVGCDAGPTPATWQGGLAATLSGWISPTA